MKQTIDLCLAVISAVLVALTILAVALFELTSVFRLPTLRRYAANFCSC
jgi:hypothetical protein